MEKLTETVMATMDLCRVGRLLYGPHWQSRLARCIGMSRRQIVRYVAGDASVPAVVELAMMYLLEHPHRR